MTGAVLAVSGASATGACSMSFPLSGFVDHAPTGSMKGRSFVLSPALDSEDMRRATAALAVALDPQGNGQHVAWDNPQSGAKGSFSASAPPFPKHDEICRAFQARITVSRRDDRQLAGSACRNPDGEWILAELTERK